MRPQRFVLQSSFTALAILAGGASAVLGQDGSRPAKEAEDTRNLPRPEIVVLNAIRSHPATAPYPIMTSWRSGKVVLSGRVGTKQVHDVAVRLAIDSGVPFRDDLVIDSGVAGAVAQTAAMAAPGAAALSSSSPYIYPPPLMGRVDDPFFGFVPPLVSFPPWWRRGVDSAPLIQPRTVPADAGRGTAPAAAAPGPHDASPDGGQSFDLAPAKGQVELTVDAAGQVFLRGVVASEEAAREIEEAARSVPGVSRVDNQLQVQVVPRRAADADTPHPLTPPPPEPMLRAPAPDRPAAPGPPRLAPPAPEPAIVPARPKPADTGPAGLDSQSLTRRVVDSLHRRPLAAELPVKVRSSGGIVTLAGRVPSAYEAMIAYRAAEQTPGVRDVVDRLEFVVPDEDHPNPLLQKGRPEDLEPYLASQIRRHVGDLAHIDRIRARGEVIELRGSLLDARDRDRLLAILRSIPVLQGFRLEPEFTAE